MRGDIPGLAYFDTSALVKAYVEEAGTSAVVKLLRQYALLSSVIGPVELGSALGRRRAAREITRTQMRRIYLRIDKERQDWMLIALDPRILARAERLCRDGVLRTLDGIHVASALLFQESSSLQVPFISTDGQQCQAAQDLGLKVLRVTV